MSNVVIVLIALVYATIVAMTYRKTGFMPALLFPLTIIVAGTMVYLRVVLTELPPEENK